MISGCPRPAMAGSASCAPASASLRNNGTGLISVFIGEKPETMVPGSDRHRECAAGNRLRRRRALRSRQRVAQRKGCGAEGGFRLIAVSVTSDIGKVRSREGRRSVIPGTYISRWAPYDRAHEPGQGQLPLGS